MKTRIAMMISVAGVLVAGSAAALVNTQVLGGSTAPSGVAVNTAPQNEQTIPAAAAATGSAAPAAGAAATATQAVYAIGTAGSVTLDTAGDVLTVVNVTHAAGWVLAESENQDATNVEIKLQSGNLEAQFHANLVFGVVTTSTESDDASSASIPVEDNHGGGSDDSGGEGSDD
ncbi:MAG: hypothetical protein JJD93_09815 [Ilumatobacteraceae bacterium]|nr:hypothetical protein [Ilumatobacteraceae bacterium]